MRASVIQGNLRDVDRLPTDLAERVRAQLDPGVVADIERAGRLAWLPLEHDIEISAVIARESDPATLFEWARISLNTALEGPLLRPMMTAALRLFGLTPAALFRVFPRGWPAVYRAVAEVDVLAHGPRCAEVVLRDVTEVLFDHEHYLQSMAGSFAAVFDVCRTPGSVTLEILDRPASLVSYRAMWSDESPVE